MITKRQRRGWASERWWRQDDEENDDDGEADKEEKEEGDKDENEEDDDDANADDEVCSINTLGGQMRCLSAANSPRREAGITRGRVFQAQPDKRWHDSSYNNNSNKENR